ncbi:UNVERIFIED_CONTAM: stage III sporulation protein AH [Acetivibrio alkalicellulosi]
MVFQRKQIVVLSLILMIVVAGYLQYSYNKSSMSVNDWDEVAIGDSYENVTIEDNDDDNTRLGEAVFVDRTLMDDDYFDAKKDEDENKSDEKALLASKEANDFFAQAKINREITRSRDKDALKEIEVDETASEDLRSSASELMMKIMSNSDKEMRIETLIKERGFSDAVVLFASDGSVDVIVKTPSLSAVQVAQISDIVSRHAEIEIRNIHVKHKY